MEQDVFIKHSKLRAFPPAQLIYIIYRRLVEHGVKATAQWLQDKILRRVLGVSPFSTSKIAPYLYVGGQHYRRGLARMGAEGITAVVNMREESDDARRGIALTHYLWLPTTDDRPPSLKELERGSAFIAEQIAAQRGVYIHCAAGVGRAPTMAAAYLVTTGMSSEKAWATIRRGRPFIRPTTPQIEVIERFSESANQQINS
ncbi:MAG: dual specificity protein phosphatase family protein [Anaerolineae bacterium]|nr:dual specificity protein phosphatase family protein [Anaerolineae bacterium]